MIQIIKKRAQDVSVRMDYKTALWLSQIVGSYGDLMRAGQISSTFTVEEIEGLVCELNELILKGGRLDTSHC